LGFTAGMRKFEPKGKDQNLAYEVPYYKTINKTEIAPHLYTVETEGLGINYLIKIFPH
jgi:hypothetical protein